MGAIADRAKTYLPLTWNALSKSDLYGADVLQGRVERAKWETLGAASPIESAEDSLDENLKEFIAKRAVLKVIPAGIEYWLNQPITVTTTGTNEMVSYESRVDGLRKLFDQLTAELAVEEINVNPPIQAATPYPAVSDGQSDILGTPNPHDFPAAFDLGQDT